ncbi:hypothetical protein M3Y94_01268100 [Aphelenchoides besseyi]|nr:hypothetical protein M3Y94_01268100 [Aphelenchoides besseyi]
MILWFIEDPLDVGQELDEAKGEIKLVIDHLPPGKSRDFFAAKLKAVKFVGSIVDDVLACQGGTKKFHYPWGFRDGRELALLSRKAILSGLYLDPADCHEIEALKAQLAEMEEELRVMKDDKKRQKFASQVERMKFLVYHCTEAEKLEATREVAFAAGKSKQRSTNAVDDDEKFGV